MGQELPAHGRAELGETLPEPLVQVLHRGECVAWGAREPDPGCFLREKSRKAPPKSFLYSDIP